jgi:hypothetical protein
MTTLVMSMLTKPGADGVNVVMAEPMVGCVADVTAASVQALVTGDSVTAPVVPTLFT